MIIKMERNRLSKEDTMIILIKTLLIKILLITLINVTLGKCFFIYCYK
jgi:hypothetical protein